MAISRTRSVGAKVTDQEYEQLEALAEAQDLTLGEWCREALLAHLPFHSARPTEETLLAEVLGLRMIVINLLSALGSGGPLTSEKIQSVLQWADEEKLATARERLKQQAANQPKKPPQSASPDSK